MSDLTMSDLRRDKNKLDEAIEALGEEVRTAGAAAAREPSNAVQLKIYDNLVVKEQTLIKQRGDLQVQLTSAFAPPAAGGAGMDAVELLRQLQKAKAAGKQAIIQKARKCVFRLTAKDKPGVGFFLRSGVAIAPAHCFTGPRPGDKVAGKFPGLDAFELTVTNTSPKLDYVLMSCPGTTDFLEVFSGRPEDLFDATLKVFAFQSAIHEHFHDSPGRDAPNTSSFSLGVVKASGIKLSEHKRCLLYSSNLWPGDSGAALLLASNGTVVGMHLGTVNDLKDKIDRTDVMNEDDNQLNANRLSDVEASLADVVQGVTQGYYALLLTAVKF